MALPIGTNSMFQSEIHQPQILHGNEKDFEEWKTIIVGKEAKGLEFVYFAPHDDWKPKQKEKQTNSQNSLRNMRNPHLYHTSKNRI